MTQKLATACAAFAVSTQALKLASIALDSAPIKRVVNYPNIHNFEAPEGVVAVDWFEEEAARREGNFGELMFDCADNELGASKYKTFFDPALFPEESKVDGRLEKI